MIAEKEKCTDSYKEKNKGAMNMSREYGYVRVSTKEQNEDRQLIAMHAVGLGKISWWRNSPEKILNVRITGSF